MRPAGSSYDLPAQRRGHEGAERTPDEEEAEREADRRRRTQHPFDLNDENTTSITFLSGQAEPLPNPDMCTVIYELTPLGKSILHRVVPRTRRERGQGHIETFWAAQRYPGALRAGLEGTGASARFYPPALLEFLPPGSAKPLQA